LSPLYYRPVTDPASAGRFFAQLRHLVHKFPLLVIIMSWPLSLYPEHHTLTQIMERISHGIISLNVFPHSFSIPDEVQAGDEKMEMQGMIRIKSLAVLSDRGMGLNKADGDWAFAIGRRRMTVRPFNLPPLGDAEPEKANDSLEF
jgi:elongator complex protein 4